jgi:hypothetical protein
MKKIRRDKPSGVIIHIFREISQENSLGSYLYLKQEKNVDFLFIFFLLHDRRAGTGLGWWEGRGCRKGDRRVNTVQKLYIHVCRCKNDTC